MTPTAVFSQCIYSFAVWLINLQSKTYLCWYLGQRKLETSVDVVSRNRLKHDSEFDALRCRSQPPWSLRYKSEVLVNLCCSTTHKRILTWSALRAISTRSGVTSPMMRIAIPGPGKGWRITRSSWIPSWRPRSRTSSLKSSRRGSINFNPC